jgi:adenylosuccinate synthase
MSCIVVVGGAWGDEAKSKVIDLYSKDMDMVVRTGSGPNAGHSIVYQDEKVVLRLMPSGIFNDDVKCVMASGMVIDPLVLLYELNTLKDKGINLTDRFFISNRAHIITNQHIFDDSSSKVSKKIGTTKKGIGPAYADKINRVGLRVADLLLMADGHVSHITALAGDESKANKWLELIKLIKPFVTDTSYLINAALDSGQSVLLENSQGSLLDLDHGSYPFVTSSNVTAGGACIGTGVGPTKIDKVVGVTKAYVTRVGAGPFPTEIEGEVADQLREAGNEYGSVTKRPRRVGWFDVPLMKYAAMVNGMDSFVVSKMDVLAEFDKVKVCTSYGGLDIVPVDLATCEEPEYVELDGWSESKDWISDVREYDKLPENAKKFIEFLEEKVGVMVGLISVGPGREQVINREEYLLKLEENDSQKRIDEFYSSLRDISKMNYV